MSEFGFISIGAHTGVWIEKEISKVDKKKILLIEPVDYNFVELKNRFKEFSNVIVEQCAIGDKDQELPFYFIKRSSITKLKKHWASGLGSFDKQHILNHHTKRFKIEEDDIEVKNVKCFTFMTLAKKYLIKTVDKLLVDVEGAELSVLSLIDYKKVLIKEIVFEKKHLDGTFKSGENFEKLKSILVSNEYKIIDIDEENCKATKI